MRNSLNHTAIEALQKIGVRYIPCPNVSLHAGIEVGFALDVTKGFTPGTEYDADAQVNFTGFTMLEVQPPVIAAMNKTRPNGSAEVTHALLGIGNLTLTAPLIVSAEDNKPVKLSTTDFTVLSILLDMVVTGIFQVPQECSRAVEFAEEAMYRTRRAWSLSFALSMAVSEDVWMQTLALKESEMIAAQSFQILRKLKDKPSGGSGETMH